LFLISLSFNKKFWSKNSLMLSRAIGAADENERRLARDRKFAGWRGAAG
jgi:hypothetical protein